jgi:PTS system galactitol-specific IIA component
MNIRADRSVDARFVGAFGPLVTMNEVQRPRIAEPMFMDALVAASPHAYGHDHIHSEPALDVAGRSGRHTQECGVDITLLKQDLVQFDREVSDQRTLFAEMAQLLRARGYVKDSFEHAIVAREAKYPTALPTVPEAIAIPHGDAEHVITPFIAPIRLVAPVPWAEMGNGDVDHPVRFVFMLGLDKADGQVAVLQSLVQAFQDPEFFRRLDAAASAQEYFDAVRCVSTPVA